MKIHLLRHAQASQDVVYQNDIERELTEKGIHQANEMGEHLTSLDFHGTVWCSEAARTRQTCEIINQHIKLPEAQYMLDLYLCSKTDFLQKIYNHDGNEDLFIIAHNNGISDLLNYLCDEINTMRTCEYFCVELQQNSWQETSQGMGTIISRYRP